MYEANQGGGDTPGLEDYLRALQKRKWLVLAVTALGLLLAFAYTNQRTDTYEAVAKVRVAPSPVGAVDARLVQPNLETEREVLDSLPTANTVIRDLGLTTPPNDLLRELTVQFRPDSDVLTAAFKDESPARAEELVNAFIKAYVDDRNAQATDFYESQLQGFADAQTLPAEELQTINSQIADFDAEIGRIASLPGDDPERTRLGELNSQRADLRQQANALRNQIRVEEQGAADVRREQASRTLPAAILQNADTPQHPIGLGATTLLLGGLVGGLIAGILGAFILDRLDTSARDEGDIELAAGASVLGSIPMFGFGSRSGAAALVMLSSGKSAGLQRARESFRRLRTSVLYLSAMNGTKSVIITSAQPGEGKSVNAANLAIALAQGGTKVALVSADMRRPTIEGLFGVRNTHGLSVALDGQGNSDVPLISVGVENLAIIPAGPMPERPGELLGSATFESLIQRLEDMYDFVIVDTPPVLAAADAGAAAAAVDGVILLVDTARTDTSTLLKVRSDLDRAGANVLGTVLNRDRSSPTGRFRSRYDYSYEKAAAGIAS